VFRRAGKGIAGNVAATRAGRADVGGATTTALKRGGESIDMRISVGACACNDDAGRASIDSKGIDKLSIDMDVHMFIIFFFLLSSFLLLLFYYLFIYLFILFIYLFIYFIFIFIFFL
jgi:hypothetical protein